MNSYSAQHWSENSHGFYEGEPYRGEAGRGSGGPFHRPPHDPRRLHVVEGTAHTNFSNRHGSPGDTWARPPCENGFRDELPHNGPPPKPFEDPRLNKKEPFTSSPGPWRRYGDPQGSPSARHCEDGKLDRGGGGEYDKKPPLGGQFGGPAPFYHDGGYRRRVDTQHGPHKVTPPGPNEERWVQGPGGPRGGGGSAGRPVLESYTPSPSSSWSPSDTGSPRYHPRGPGTDEPHGGPEGLRKGPPENFRPQFDNRHRVMEYSNSPRRQFIEEDRPHGSYGPRRDGPYIPPGPGRMDGGNIRRPLLPRHMSLDGGRLSPGQFYDGRPDLCPPHQGPHQGPTLHARREERTHLIPRQDPRVFRKSSALHSPLSTPSHPRPQPPNSHSLPTLSLLVLKEHSYCKHSVGGSELQPIAEKSDTVLQSQQRPRYFLTPQSSKEVRSPAPAKVIIPKSILVSATNTSGGDAKVITPRPSPVEATKSGGEVSKQELTPQPSPAGPGNGMEATNSPLPPKPCGPVSTEDVPVQVEPFATPEDAESCAVDDRDSVMDCPGSPAVSLDGFELDLDSEPEFSEDEEWGVDGGEEKEKEEEDMDVGSPSLVVSLPSASIRMYQWSVTQCAVGKLKICRKNRSESDASPLEDPAGGESMRSHVQQFTKRNGITADWVARNGVKWEEEEEREIQVEQKGVKEEEEEIRKKVEEEEEEEEKEEAKEEMFGMVFGNAERARMNDTHLSRRLDTEEPVEPAIEVEDRLMGNGPSVPVFPPEEFDAGNPGEGGEGEKECTSGQSTPKGKRKRGRGHHFFLYNKRQKKSNRLSRDEDSPARHLRPRSKTSPKFQDFVPVVLPTRSRTETSTLLRRRELEMEIEQNEWERRQTARPSELADGEEGDILDDCGSVYSMMTSSGSRDVDSTSTASKSTILDEFSSELIARCKRITTARNSGDTPLHKVCRTGKYDMAKCLLLVENAAVNAQDNAGWTPLHEACSAGNTRIAELLLQNGADANISSADGTRPIHDAIEGGDLELVKLLIQYGADPLAELGDSTPVEHATQTGHPEASLYLQGVVRERQERMRRSRPPTVASPASSHKSAPSRHSQKDKLKKQTEVTYPRIPVDGYSDNDPKLCPELDFPLFYISPIMELADVPFLAVYNFQVFAGSNPRRHNFYMFTDVLNRLHMDDQQFHREFPNTVKIKMSVSEFLRCMEHGHNQQVPIPPHIKRLPKSDKMVFVPVCNDLRERLGIIIENFDD